MTAINFNDKEKIGGFSLIKAEEIPEIRYFGSKTKSPKNTVYELLHDSGAKLLYIENDDLEMAFTIGFKTLPKDSTGVFHILEHSVLCGSRKFPVKEPFTNLLKSSMQTFLNAMTFPDKTIYPVASTNEKDLYNLIDVYMDAVLFPNIYLNKNIFLQEGGHKTLDGFSGVVYNEMQGVYSDPQEHIFEGLMQQLFPKSCYSYSSGGSPKIVKTLSYEEFLAQHNSNYNLNNAYIIIYGNLNIDKMLKYLDTQYLSKSVEIKKWRNNVGTCPQGNFENNFKKIEKPLKIKVETNKENAECGAGFVLERDHKKVFATRVLLNAIASSNESPLKKALLHEEFASDIDFDMLSEVYEPFIIVECKNSKENTSENLIKLISDNVKKLTKDGISKELLEASISNIEFKFKERIPEFTNGIDYAICTLSEWLYDDDKSISALKYLDDIKWLKSQINTNYFNDLANEIFVDNKHVASVEVVPIDTKKIEKPKYSQNEKDEIRKVCTDLEKWQNTPDSKENESKIPVMKKSDIGKMNVYPKWNVVDEHYPIIKYDLETNGISHINRYYSINNISQKDLFYAKLISILLGKLATDKYDSSEVDLMIQKYFGYLDFSCAFFENVNDIYDLDLKFAIRSSCLDKYDEYQFWFIDEILDNTKYDNKQKIKTILNQIKIAMEQNFITAGHQAAINKSLTKILPIYNILDSISGVKFYKDLKNCLNNFDENFPKLSANLKKISKKMFSTREAISYAGSGTIINQIVIDTIEDEQAKQRTKAKTQTNILESEAFKIPGNVNYCAMTNDLRTIDKTMKGQNITASKMIALQYLWNEVRVKNGAYGAGMLFNVRGTMQYYSFRDPQNLNTLKSFSASTKWLQNMEIDDQFLDNFIISTVAKIDAPAIAREIMRYQDNCYFSFIKHENREIIRNEIINTKKSDIKESAKLFEQLCKNSSKCIFGGKNIDKLKDSNFKIIDLFEH